MLLLPSCSILYVYFRCAQSPVLKTRLMAARAIQPLVFKTQILTILRQLFNMLPLSSDDDGVCQNYVHGILLQVIPSFTIV